MKHSMSYDSLSTKHCSHWTQWLTYRACIRIYNCWNLEDCSSLVSCDTDQSRVAHRSIVQRLYRNLLLVYDDQGKPECHFIVVHYLLATLIRPRSDSSTKITQNSRRSSI